MSERTEIEVREWAKTLDTSFLWGKLQYVLQPIVTPPVIGSDKVVSVFDDRTKAQLTKAGSSHKWDSLLKTIRSFTSKDSNYKGHFWLKEEVGVRNWQDYPHDLTRVPSLTEDGKYRYFGDIPEKGEAYNEMHVFLDEIVARAQAD